MARSASSLVEDRFTPARRHAAGHAFDDAADGVARLAHFFDEPNHPLCRRRIGAAHDIRFNRGGLYLLGIDRGGELPDLLDVGENLHAVAPAQELLGNRPGGDPADGLAGAAASTPGPTPDAVLRLVRVIGVRRPKLHRHLRIGLGARVFVPDPQRDRRAQGLALEGAGEDLDAIGFFARRDDARLAGPAAVQLRLDVRLGQFEPRRTSIHHYAHALAVGFTPGSDAEKMAKSICHALKMGEKRPPVKPCVEPVPNAPTPDLGRKLCRKMANSTKVSDKGPRQRSPSAALWPAPSWHTSGKH